MLAITITSDPFEIFALRIVLRTRVVSVFTITGSCIQDNRPFAIPIMTWAYCSSHLSFGVMLLIDLRNYYAAFADVCDIPPVHNPADFLANCVMPNLS